MSIQRGELKVLIDLLGRDPTSVNACDEVSVNAIVTTYFDGSISKNLSCQYFN